MSGLTRDYQEPRWKIIPGIVRAMMRKSWIKD
jgi:hypothetical protein